MGNRTDLFVPLGAGIRTDIADALLPLGHDLEAENVQFDQTGALVKRFGHLAQPTTVQPGGGTILQPWQLATHKGARVSFANPSGIPQPASIFSKADSAWNIPPSTRHGPIVTALTRLNTSGNAPRIASGGGFYFLLYKDLFTVGLLHFDMIDATTGHVSVPQTFLVGGGPITTYDVVFCNGFAVAVTNEVAGNIVFRTLTPATKAITTTAFAVGAAAGGMDVIVLNATTISVVYANAAAQAAGVDFVPSTLVTTGYAIRDAAAAAIPLDLGRVSWAADLGGSGKVAIATVSTTQGLRMQWDLTGGATRTATTTYNADPAIVAAVASLTAHTTGASATGDFQILTTISSFPLSNNLTRIASRSGGVLRAPSVLFRSLSLLSKAWVSSSLFYALFSFTSPGNVDNNSYVMSLGSALGTQPPLPSPEAIFGVGNTGNTDQTGASLNIGLATVIPTSATTFTTAISFLSRIGAQASGGFSATSLGIELVTVSYLQSVASPTTGAPVEAADSLLVPGGTIGQFDGQAYGEMGFAYSPPQPTLTPAGGGALTANSIYWYVIIWARMDAQGRLWRSGTSIPASVTLGGAQTQVTIAVPTIRVTGWSNVIGEIYRGIANDENLFQKVGQITNDVTVDFVNFVDTNSDAALANGEEIYTGQNDNAILNNDTIPGSLFVFIFQNRIWFISADDPTELWFSNIISPGNGPRFNSQNIVRLADAHGATIAAGVMDDKVVALKGDAIYSWNGDGPDDAGNGSYSSPLIVSLGVGTTNPRSVVSNKEGVFFESTAGRPGMQLINHGLSIETAADGSAFGAAVQKYAGEQIMAAVQIAEQSQVRFYCLSGRVLVYDLVSKQWVTFLLSTAGAHIVSAVATSGAALVATDAVGVWLEDTTGATYTDAGNAMGERIASPWISVDGIGGFQRLLQLIGRGQTLGNHTLTVQQYTNFDDNTLVGSKTWAETVASTPLWNWEWNRPRVARMSALKLVVSEASTGPGFKAEGVSMTLGTRSGLNRQPTTTRGP